jgi:hypothetical protein
MAVIAPDMMIMHVGTGGTLIPANYSRVTEMDGKFIKGWGAEAPNTTGGSAQHSHTSPAHTHTINSHTHTFSNNSPSDGGQDTNAGVNDLADRGHYHTSSTMTAINGGNLSDAVTYGNVTWEPEHLRVIFIKPTSTNQPIPANACIFYMSDTLPVGGNWAFYTNADARFIRGADTGANGGVQSGTATHEHSITHTHSVVAHSHTGSLTGTSHCNRQTSEWGGGNAHATACGHTHSVSFSSVNLSSSQYSGNAGSADTGIEPLHTKVRIIQNVSGIPQAVPLGGIVASLSLTVAPRGWAMKTALQDYFIKSTGTNGQQGTTAGSNSHSHALSNSHTHTDTTGSHTHTGSSSTGSGDGSTGVSSEYAASSGHTHPIVSVSSTTASWGNAQTQANSTSWQPPYRTASFLELVKNISGGQFLEDTL